MRVSRTGANGGDMLIDLLGLLLLVVVILLVREVL